jgi:hypothetical protein
VQGAQSRCSTDNVKVAEVVGLALRLLNTFSLSDGELEQRLVHTPGLKIASRRRTGPGRAGR